MNKMKEINWKNEAYRFGYYNIILLPLAIWYNGYIPHEIMFGISALWGYGACKLESKIK